MYEQYETQIWIAGIFATILFIWLLYIVVKSALLNKAVEFNDCQKEFRTIHVGKQPYTTYQGAKNRCEYLYKKHGINAEVEILSDYEAPIKTNAVEYFKLTR